MSNTSKKIPYDVEPITREYNTTNKSPQTGGSLGSKVIITLLLVLNITLCCIFAFSMFSKKSTTIINTTYNVNGQNSANALAVSKAKLSVVCIGAGSKSTTNPFTSSNLPSYEELFNDTASKGSGVIIRLDKQAGEAYVLTCFHVVNGYTDNIFLCLFDSKDVLYGQFVGRSIDNDIAVIKVVSNKLKTTSAMPATLADSSFIAEGDDAIAVGNPQGLGFAVTIGHVSRTSIFVTTNTGLNLRTFQVDTAINGGNSGGGLFDKDGNLIGIVQSKNTNSNIDNVAYAVHINSAITLADNLIAGKRLSYAPAGYTTKSVGTKIEFMDGKCYTFDQVAVASVVGGSDADRAGLKEEDILISFKVKGINVMFTSQFSYLEVMYSLEAGDKVEYTVLRGGNTKTLTLTVSSLAS